MRKNSTEAVREWRKRAGIEKVRELARGYAKERRKRIPHLALRNNYRLSELEAKRIYEQMQTASCEICHGDRQVVFDHNHDTGKFRGFLCQACNSGIGQFQDNPALMEAAIEYLRSKK